jgi:hypothetical protein
MFNTIRFNMMRFKNCFVLVGTVATSCLINFSQVANAQVGYAGPYGGYYPMPGAATLPPFPSPSGERQESARTFSGEYQFECEERLGFWELREMQGQYPFNSPEDEYLETLVEDVKRSCQHLPNP